MNITTDIKSVTYLKSKAAELLNDLNENRRPIVITQNGEPRAVIQDAESYEAMRKALGLMQLINQGMEDVRNGNVTSNENVMLEMRNMLEKNEQAVSD